MIALTPEQESAIAHLASEDWPAAKLTALCLGWVNGQSTRLIGIGMGITKNAVVGKAHRLRDCGVLASRESPIAFTGPRVEKPKRAPAVTLAPLSSAPVPIFHPLPMPPAFNFATELTRSRFAEPARPAVVFRPPSLLPMKAACRFPLWGDDEAPTQVFCDKPAPLGDSWCAACRARVFFRSRPRALEQAA